MSWLRDLPGVNRFFHHEASPERVDREIDEELRFHFDMAIAALVARGLAPDEARAEAARRFGDFGGTRQMMREIDRGRLVQERRAAWVSSLWQDTQYAARSLRMRPGFAAVLITTLALGIGANAAMFGVVDRLLLRPPAFLAHPERTHRVILRRVINGREGLTNNTSVRRYRDIAQHTRSFEQVAAYFVTNMAVGRGEDARERPVALASASYWSVFDVRPALGRFFTPAEADTTGVPPVAVLAHQYWKTQLAGRADVLGMPLQVGSIAYMVIGVAPEGFTGTDLNPIAFLPIGVAGEDMWGQGSGPRLFGSYTMSWLEILALRKDGASLEQATADATSAYRASLAQQHTEAQVQSQQPSVILGSAIRERGPQRGQAARVAIWLVGVAAVVLLVACANVASLLVARALRRRREIAVRLALGVSRRRLISQLLTETTLLAVLGAVAGMAVGHWGGRLLQAAFAPDADWGSFAGDPRVLGFTMLATLTASFLTGLAPAIHASRPVLTEALKGGVREGASYRSRTRTSLLLFQCALSVVLLVGAGLFVRSLHNVRSLDLGYDADQVLYVSTEWRGVRLPPDALLALRLSMLERLRQLPGVVSAARTVGVPFWQTVQLDLYVPGIDSVSRLGDFVLNAVSPGYFETMGTRLIRGRPIAEEDRAGAPRVMVVSDQMAQKLWPNQDPLGKCVRVNADTMPCTTVVGIAEGIRRGGLDDDPMLQYYIPIDHYDPHGGGLFVRTSSNAAGLVEPVRRELQSMMPGLAYVKVRPMMTILAPLVRSWQLGASLFALFGALALVLAAIGLYGMLSYDVAQRTHEMGVRIALGARGRDVLGLVLARGVLLTALAVIIGSAIALASGKYLEPLLFHVSPRDPATYITVVCTLILVALVASAWPAIRASRVDPNEALRAD